MIDLEKYLQIESDEKILDFRINKVPLWLIVRTTVIYKLVFLNEKMENPHIRVSIRDLSFKKKLYYAYYTLVKNPFLADKNDILIIRSVANDIKKDNFYFNSLYYKVLENFGNSILLEQSFKFSYRQPKRERTLYIDLIYVITKLLAKGKILSKNEIRTVNSFLKFLKKRIVKLNFLIDDNFFIELKNILYKSIKSYEIKKFFFSLLLKKINPKLLIVQCAHEFAHYPLFLVAKKKSIKVAEYQHGYIGNDHPSYNFHPNIKDKIKEYLPDYMLTWGKYWSNSINTPSKKIEIGNFLLDDVLKEVKVVNKCRKTILIISGGKYPDKYVRLGKEIKKYFPGYELYFRPHPAEIPAIKKRYSELIRVGYKIDTGNLYTKTLPNSEIVISLEKSTVLYEAMLYTHKVFWITEKKDNNLPFYQVSSVGELIYYIKNNKYPRLFLNEEIWEKNPVEKFKKFLEREIYIRH